MARALGLITFVAACDPDVSDGGAPRTEGCTATASGGCDCVAVCEGHEFVLTCDGSTCSCEVDGTADGSFSQGGDCVEGDASVAEQTVLFGCYSGTTYCY